MTLTHLTAFLRNAVLLTCVVLLAAAPIVHAQDGGDTPTSPHPDAFWIDGIEQHWQLYNRCSAAALRIQLSGFDFGGSHTDVARFLNPHPEDVSVRLEEMVHFVEQHGMTGVIRYGGTPELLERLIAAGFPVLIETAYYLTGDEYGTWYSHNRVAMGYEAYPREVMYVYDPLNGNGPDDLGLRLPYYDLDARWRHFNRDYLVIYRPDQQEQVAALLGNDWDALANAENTRQQALADRETYADVFALYNLASAQLLLGEVDEAATNFDRARELGLPWRFFWYRFEALDAYIQAGRYQDALDLVRATITVEPDIEEMYFYAGLAYEGLGNLERARANFRVAVQRNPNYVEARAELTRLGG
jgi:hypothetical protein